MFQGFLNDPETYRQCELYWEKTVAEIAGSFGEADEWNPWQPRYSPNGTPMEKDGNPIFDAWNRRRNRAVRIIQAEATDELVRIAAWLSSPHDSPYIPAEELVIFPILCPQTAELSKSLLETWISPNTTVADMESYIEANIAIYSNLPD